MERISSYGQQSASPAPRSENLVQAVTDFDPHLAHLNGLVERLFALIERITGPTPSVVAGADASKPDRGGMLTEIHRRSHDLGHLVDRLDTGMNRLDGLLGG